MIKLYCDSAANLPTELIKKHSITVVPFIYTVNGVQSNTYGDRFDGKAYYDGIRNGATVKTSMVNMTTFEAYFEKALAAGDEVLYIGLSGGVSGTANAAKNAAAELLENYPDGKVEVIDSLGASLGAGLLVVEAAEMIAGGASMSEITEHIISRIPHMCQCFTVDDLKHLHRSGRISGGAAVIGGLLGIRPLLLGNEEGKIVMYDKIRGMKQAMDALAARWKEYSNDSTETIGIAHADNEKFANYLLDQIRLAGFTGECINVCYEPTTGAHVGPGAIALFFFGKSRI